MLFVDGLENPFRSPAPRGLRSQVCSNSTKNHSDGHALRRTRICISGHPKIGTMPILPVKPNIKLLPLSTAINLSLEVPTLWQLAVLSTAGIATNFVIARIGSLPLPFNYLFPAQYSSTERGNSPG